MVPLSKFCLQKMSNDNSVVMHEAQLTQKSQSSILSSMWGISYENTACENHNVLPFGSHKILPSNYKCDLTHNTPEQNLNKSNLQHRIKTGHISGLLKAILSFWSLKK